MGRSGRKRRRPQEEDVAESGPSASLSNGQAGSPAPAEAEPRPLKAAEPFHEPLHNLPDDAATLAALLHEAAAAVACGPARLADPRRALRLLRHCAARLPPPQLTEQLAGWCQFLAGALRAPRHQWCRDAACRAAGRLLTEAAPLEEAHRLLAGGPLAQLLAPLLDSAEQATPASLRCLRVILLHFGRACGTVKNQLRGHLLQLFDCARPSVSRAACRCVALLPHTGPSGSAGAAYVAAWGCQLRGLIRCVHQHLDRLLDGIVEIQTFDVPEEESELVLPDLEETEPVQLRYRLARRIAALMEVITVMLSSATQQPVCVPVSALLDLVCRCQAAGAAVVPTALELRAAGRCLDDVRGAALRLLEALVACCGSSLLLRATLLNRLLLSALQPAADGAPPPSPAADAARCQALRALRAWLLVSGAGSGLHGSAEQLVAALSDDVRPPEPAAVTLQSKLATNGVAPSGGKRKRRPASEWQEPAIGDRPRPPGELARPRRCQAALLVLEQLVTSLGPLLTVPVHRSLQQLAVGQLLELQRTATPPPPYSQAGCRAGLYRLLSALVADPHPQWPAPLQFAVRLFAQGAADPDTTVSAVCRGGQALCLRAMHPSFPALFFPADLSAFSKPPVAEADAPPDEDGSPLAVDRPAYACPGPIPGGDPGGERGMNAGAAAAAGRGSPPAAAVAGPGPGPPPPAAGPSAGGQCRSPGDQKPPTGWPAARRPVTTVTIASSEESSGSADEAGRRSVELDDDDDDQRSVVLEASDDERSPGTGAPDEDEVEILETKRPRRADYAGYGDGELAPDVADMLKDFVNEDPEVE